MGSLQSLCEECVSVQCPVRTVRMAQHSDLHIVCLCSCVQPVCVTLKAQPHAMLLVGLARARSTWNSPTALHARYSKMKERRHTRFTSHIHDATKEASVTQSVESCSTCT